MADLHDINREDSLSLSQVLSGQECEDLHSVLSYIKPSDGLEQFKETVLYKQISQFVRKAIAQLDTREMHICLYMESLAEELDTKRRYIFNYWVICKVIEAYYVINTEYPGIELDDPSTLIPSGNDDEISNIYELFEFCSEVFNFDSNSIDIGREVS